MHRPLTSSLVGARSRVRRVQRVDTGASRVVERTRRRARARVHDAVLVTAEMLLGLALVLYRLGSKSLWLDEAFTWSSVHRSWSAFLHHVTTSEAGGAAYLTFMWAWSRVSDTESWLRLPSALSVVALVPAVYLISRKLFSRRVGLIAGLLVAINVNVVVFGQETRGYLVTITLATVAMWAFTQEITEPSRGSFIAWVVASGVLVYLQPAALGVVAAQVVSLAWVPTGSIPVRRLAVGWFAIAVLSLPMLALVASEKGHLNTFLEGGRSAGAIVRAVGSIAGTGARPFVVIACLLATIALVTWLRIWLRVGRSATTWTHGFLWSWLVVPTLVTLLASYPMHNFQSRYFVLVMPALMLLVAVGICSLRTTLVQTAAVTGAVVAAGLGLHTWYFDHPRDNWRAATPYVVANARVGDGVVFFGDEARIPFEYYLHRGGGTTNGLKPLFPAQPWSQFRTGEERQVFASVEQLGRWSREGTRIWVVTARGGGWPPGENDVAANRRRAELLGAMRVVSQRSFDGVDIALYVPK